jgi:transketolase
VRNEFIDELKREARLNPRIFLVVGDLGYSVVESFASEFPDRFLNAGVAEQGMTGIAAGLASEGFQVFTYSIANFPTFRCAEQFRNDIAYHQFPVTAVAVGGGLAYGNLGYSHHAVQDLALMRCFPGVLIAAPGDPWEARACVRFLSANPQPAYLRLGKAGEPEIHKGNIEIHAGLPQLIQSASISVQSNGAILTTGAALKLGLDVVSRAEIKTSWSLYSAPLWNREAAGRFRQFVRAHRYVAIIEDHLAAGGFCSFIREILEPEPDLQVRVRGFSLDPKICGMVANQATLNAEGGLDAELIASQLLRLST